MVFSGLLPAALFLRIPRDHPLHFGTFVRNFAQYIGAVPGQEFDTGTTIFRTMEKESRVEM
jgi:hypothetical protein